MSHDLNAVFYSHTYHPIQAGSIDGTDTNPHDNAVCRAMLATSTGLYDPLGDPKALGNPQCIVFVGRLSKETTESTLQEVMSRYGRVKNLRLVRHIVTGASQGYAFVEYETEKEMQYAYAGAHLIKIDGSQVLVDYNRQLMMPGWIPRRLGGGLGGRKESGQLRFGGRDRPFRKPLRPIPEKELEKLGIPLPGGYMQRYETPPLPRRRVNRSTSRNKEDEVVSEVASSNEKKRGRYDGLAEPSRSYGERSDKGRLDEKYEQRRLQDQSSHGSHRHHDYSRREYDEHESRRKSHHHGRDRHREEQDRRSHHRAEREDSQKARGYRRSQHDGRHAERFSSESDSDNLSTKRRKRRHRSRSISKEPKVDDRWEP